MTTRQRKFFKEILTSTSFAAAARKAGYSPKSCRVSANRNITTYNEFLLKILIEADIDISSLSKAIRDGIKSSNESVKFKYVKLLLATSEKLLTSNDVIQARERQKVEAALSEENFIKSRLRLALLLSQCQKNSISVVRSSDLPENIKTLSADETINSLTLTFKDIESRNTKTS